jgi:hypothetical protein
MRATKPLAVAQDSGAELVVHAPSVQGHRIADALSVAAVPAQMAAIAAAAQPAPRWPLDDPRSSARSCLTSSSPRSGRHPGTSAATTPHRPDPGRRRHHRDDRPDIASNAEQLAKQLGAEDGVDAAVRVLAAQV